MVEGQVGDAGAAAEAQQHPLLAHGHAPAAGDGAEEGDPPSGQEEGAYGEHRYSDRKALVDALRASGRHFRGMAYPFEPIATRAA